MQREALRTSPAKIATPSALAALVAPLPLDRFLASYWPARVFEMHGPLSRLPALFASPELSSFRALAARYQGWLGFGRGIQGSRMVSVQQVHPAHLYEMGLSVYLPDIQPSVPGADAFLRQLERDVGAAAGSVRMTVWASPRGDGAPTHFDGEDVFSIQLCGSKRFEVAPMREYANPVGPQYGPGAAPYDEMYAQLVDGFPDAAKAEFRAVDMKPGSVLYIPRGTWHRTVAEEDSFAISIGLNPPSIAEAFIAQLRFVLLQDPAWRQPLYAARGEGETALAEVLQGAARAATAIAPRDIRPVMEHERLGSIDRSSRFQPEAGARLAFAPGQDVFEVKVATGGSEQTTLTMNFPRECAALCRWLAARKAAFAAGELAQAFPALPFQQLAKLLDVLTRAKYLRLLWFPRLPAA